MYQGRSPLKDVVRSVVMGATMITPAVMEGCSRTQQPPPNPPPDTNAPDASTAQIAVSPQDAAAPPPAVVRPRVPENNVNTMPTRGFAGGARVRG